MELQVAATGEPRFQRVRGMHDLLPEKATRFRQLEEKAKMLFELYGYGEMRTPILEPLSLFERALGTTTDIVEKEMFTVKDKGERALCLRPEGTAGVVRAFIEQNFRKTIKLFYMGPMFRAERPQKGRYRQFFQIGTEYFGNPSPAADAETIQLSAEILKSAGVEIAIRINSIGCATCRKNYQKILLVFLKKNFSQLCENCKKRMERNPLRVLDCKGDSGKFPNAPKTTEYLCLECKQHFTQVQELLAAVEIPFEIFPHLVRGLDYYTRTVFEIFAKDKKGSQDALAGGGRYDGLVRELGGPDTPAVGFALGVDRVIAQLEETGKIPMGRSSPERKKIFVAAVGNNTIPKAFQLLTQLRRAGFEADALLKEQSLKSQMRMADSWGAQDCVIVGEDELKENSVTLRDMKNQSQKKVPWDAILSALQ